MVTAGDTLMLPLAATVPMPWLMLTVVASDELHVRVEVPPLKIVIGLADMLTVGSWFTVTVALWVAVPKEFDEVMV